MPMTRRPLRKRRAMSATTKVKPIVREDISDRYYEELKRYQTPKPKPEKEPDPPAE